MRNWSTLKKLIWLYAAKLNASSIIKTITGNLPLVLQNAIDHAIVSLTRYGLCTQDGTPTPDAPVDIMTNNGALKFGWQDIITTSALSGYGTYVSPSGTAGNRAYKWFKDLPNGTYTFAVDGDYELIVQWRDPADASVLVPSSYENLSGWITSGEVVLDKEGGGYGIAVRRTSGTSSITPSNFDGTLHVQEQGLYTEGTPEVLTVGASGATDQTATVESLLAVGSVADEQNIISGAVNRKVGIKVFKGNETVTSSSGGTWATPISDKLKSKTFMWCSHYPYSSESAANAPDKSFVGYSSQNIGFKDSAFTQSTDVTAFFKDQYDAGTPVIVIYPLIEETTESVAGQALHTVAGTNVVSGTANVSPIELKAEYIASE